MADSEDSRTLPSIRYRNLLSAAEQLLSTAAAESDVKYGETGEALMKWTAWSHAHFECLRLCGIQQRLERALFKTVAVQPIDPPELGWPKVAPIQAHKDLARRGKQERYDDLPLSQKMSELAASNRRSETSKTAIAHRRAKAAEDTASAREQFLAQQLWSVSGNSAISAIAKMHCVLEQGEPFPNSAEFPWPQIRSALADLLMASTLRATVFCRNSHPSKN